MDFFKHVFDVFSKRPEATAKTKHEVPETTRNRVLLWSQQLYSNSRSDFGSVGRGDYNAEFWQEIHRRLLLRAGRLQLFQSRQGPEPAEAVAYVLTCPGEEFLDFLEDIFTTDCFSLVSMGEDKVVDELNAILRQDNLPYHVTQLVKETVRETTGRYVGHDAIYIRAYPKVIMKENEVLHANAIAPALALLQRPHFQGASSEYLAALEDYRKGALGGHPFHARDAVGQFRRQQAVVGCFHRQLAHCGDPHVDRHGAEPAGLQRNTPGAHRRLGETGPGFLDGQPGEKLVKPEVVHAARDRRRDAVQHQRLQLLPLVRLRNYNQIIHLGSS